jgi:hypothetical protein
MMARIRPFFILRFITISPFCLISSSGELAVRLVFFVVSA